MTSKFNSDQKVFINAVLIKVNITETDVDNIMNI